MSSNAKTTLNRIFVRVMMIGFATMIVVGGFLIHQGQQRDEEKWQSDTISKSAALTASYYSRLVTLVILDRQADIKSFLEKIQTAEELSVARVVSQDSLSPEVMRTCKVEATSAYFYEVPACVETAGGRLRIYHELRSAGFGVGYLLKEVEIPEIRFWRDAVTARNIALILCFFILFHLIKLFHLKKYIMTPTKRLVDALRENRRIDAEKTDYKLKEWQTLAESLQNAVDTASRYELDAKIGQMASQVAHDIRSPLAALDVVSNQTNELPEENRLLIRRAVQRIRDIANDLSNKKKDAAKQDHAVSQNETMSVQLLSGLIDTLVSEKRLQYRDQIGIEIEPLLNESSYGLFAAIQPIEFKRVLSNLINNAVEALADNGKVEVKLSGGDTISIQVSDNGNGIPPEIFPKLMQRGETHGKTGGSGLGLYHARMSVEKWGGSLGIESKIGKGTIITISLPKAEAPSWFVEKINLKENSLVVVIDDDASIHQIWKKRFENEIHRNVVRLLHFSSPEEFSHWHTTAASYGNTSPLYLCDYEFLNHNKTGLDIIYNFGIANEAILITSRFEEDQVRSGCENLGVRMIPKNLAGFVPIQIVSTSSGQRPSISQERKDIPDAILIDDDDLVHMNWKMAAKRKNKIVRIYAKPDDFFDDLPSFSTDIPVYIDSNLSDGVKGETVAKKLKIKGFDNLYLATGYEAAKFDAMPWIKGIVGKNPPWA